MQRIAVPMIGGMVSSTVVTLVVIPAIFAVVKCIGLCSPQMDPAGAEAVGGVMHNMMDGGMWGMGIVGLILLIVLVLVIAALVKYLFFR